MRLPGHHREMPGQGDQDKIGDSLLEKGVFAIAKRKIRTWEKEQIMLADKQPMQSNTVKGAALGLVGFILTLLVKLFHDKLVGIGMSDELIQTLLTILEGLTGTGGAVAAIGLRQAQGRVIASGNGGNNGNR